MHQIADQPPRAVGALPGIRNHLPVAGRPPIPAALFAAYRRAPLHVDHLDPHTLVPCGSDFGIGDGATAVTHDGDLTAGETAVDVRRRSARVVTAGVEATVLEQEPGEQAGQRGVVEHVRGRTARPDLSIPLEEAEEVSAACPPAESPDDHMCCRVHDIPALLLRRRILRGLTTSILSAKVAATGLFSRAAADRGGRLRGRRPCRGPRCTPPEGPADPCPHRRDSPDLGCVGGDGNRTRRLP